MEEEGRQNGQNLAFQRIDDPEHAVGLVRKVGAEHGQIGGFRLEVRYTDAEGLPVLDECEEVVVQTADADGSGAPLENTVAVYDADGGGAGGDDGRLGSAGGEGGDGRRRRRRRRFRRR